MKKSKLTFVCTDKGIMLNKELLPQPAIKYIPNWYKNMKVPHTIDKERPILSKILKPKTIKQCPSFVEMFNEGYILPAPTDIYIYLNGDKFEWRTPITYKTFHNNGEIDFHADIQMVDHLPSNSNIKAIFKIIFPYVLFGPKGYNLKIMPVPYAFNNDYHANYGIQDLDNIFEINVQINFTSDKNEILIKRGDPIALVIPYKKDKFDVEYEYMDDSKHKNKMLQQDFKIVNTFNNRYFKSL